MAGGWRKSFYQFAGAQGESQRRIHKLLCVTLHVRLCVIDVLPVSSVSSISNNVAVVCEKNML